MDELLDTISSAELTDWIAEYELREQDAELATLKAKQNAGKSTGGMDG